MGALTDDILTMYGMKKLVVYMAPRPMIITNTNGIGDMSRSFLAVETLAYIL